MSEVSNQTATKKKAKKRRKGKSGKGTEPVPINGAIGEQLDKLPKQVTGKGDTLITTSKCSRCKGTFRQMTNQSDVAMSQGEAWNCPSCVQEMKSEGEAAHSPIPTSVKEPLNTRGTSGCNCSACVAKRENAVSPEVERDAHITQTYWMEIRHVVRCIYRENVSLTNHNKTSTIGSDKMRMIVKKLCNRDPHQFFQRLETLAREYLLEVKVRLLEQLSCGFNTPQLAIEFIQMLLEEYSTLCNAMPALLYLLKPLEDCEYVQKLGMTIELMNKNIFRELIFAESFMSSNLPLIIAQLRLASLADHIHDTTAEELDQRYIALDHEMEEICQIWKSAKDHLNQFEDEKSHFEEIKADGESFKQQVKLQHSTRSKDIGNSAKSKHEEQSVPAPDVSVTSHMKSAPIVKTIDKPYSDCNGVQNPDPIHRLLQSKMSDNEPYNSEQAAEWARLLFKCIKPSMDTEFSLDGDVATHTITLLLDTTQLDLMESKPCCARNDLIKYRRLGLEVEEIVEVAMKLSSLRNLGLNIKIEDLFDDEGFSLSVVNGKLQDNDVYFKDDYNYIMTNDGLSAEEEVDLQKAKDSILQRHDTIFTSSLLLPNRGKTRQQDFLRGLTMKIRFRKTLTVDDLDKHFISDDGKVAFHSCDQVQMKLTHMEMNSACLMTCCNAVGDSLGLEIDPSHLMSPPVNSNGNKTPEDYVFTHTNSHHEFMDLLLEKRKQLENTIISNEQERRNLWTQMNGTERASKGSKALPRYQVQEQQESNPKEHNSRLLKNNFKPFFYTKDSQPCQCSACVGAMATIITSTFRHTLGVSDSPPASVSLQCSLGTHLGVDKHQTSVGKDLLKATHVNCSLNAGASHSCTSPLSKEGLWQNWMSTSGSAQLENESHIANSHHHYHHHNGAHCCHCGENAQADGDSLKVCSYHEADAPSISNNGCQSAGVCSHHHGSSSCLANEGEGSETSSLAPANGTSGEVARRYCPCCYCELFGHNVPPTAPTSHNYTKRRDIMRQKLEEKKKKRKENTSEHPNCEKDDEQQTSVEELLAFIEGGDEEETEQSMVSKLSKRQRKKLKKLHVLGDEDCLFHHSHHESVEECVKMDRSLCDQAGTCSDGRSEMQVNPKRKKHSQSVFEQTRNGNKLKERKKESTDVDEYDDELEEFKRFCFADAPTGPRKKIPVTLNMHDIMSKFSN